MTTQFSGLVMAYEDESEEAFLTTQQVDEARHTQFFDRFYREVIGIDDPDWAKRLGRVREELNDAFVELFDKALVEANQRLVANPRDLQAKVDFVTTYHMVIEGTLALTGQNFMTTDYLERQRPPPRLRRGIQEGRPRRAPPRRLRHLVPEGEVRLGSRAGRADARAPAAAAAGRERRPGPDGRRPERLGAARTTPRTRSTSSPSRRSPAG